MGTFHVMVYKEGGEGLQVEFQDLLAMTLLPARPGSAASSQPVLGLADLPEASRARPGQVTRDASQKAGQMCQNPYLA